MQSLGFIAIKLTRPQQVGQGEIEFRGRVDGKDHGEGEEEFGFILQQSRRVLSIEDTSLLDAERGCSSQEGTYGLSTASFDTRIQLLQQPMREICEHLIAKYTTSRLESPRSFFCNRFPHRVRHQEEVCGDISRLCSCVGNDGEVRDTCRAVLSEARADTHLQYTLTRKHEILQ